MVITVLVIIIVAISCVCLLSARKYSISHRILAELPIESRSVLYLHSPEKWPLANYWHLKCDSVAEELNIKFYLDLNNHLWPVASIVEFQSFKFSNYINPFSSHKTL